MYLDLLYAACGHQIGYVCFYKDTNLITYQYSRTTIAYFHFYSDVRVSFPRSCDHFMTTLH
jgi:hypothetical protein